MKLVSRLSLKLIAAELLIIAALCLCHPAKPAEGAGKDKEHLALIKKCTEQAELLKTKLGDASLWSDVKRKKELLGYLKLAGTLRPKDLVPVLVPHIDYDPNPGQVDTMIRPPWLRYPAYGVLLRIGAPSIPYILGALKKRDAKKGEDKKHRLYASCLYEIYGLGGHGGAVARKRLELELAETKNEKEATSLRVALEYALFKD